jgi:twitching motility two-component system response regulator PilH
MQTVLIVDDVQTDRELVGQLVTSEGHRPLYAADGAEAVVKAKEHRPSLILLDVVMPTQDGFKTCRTLKADPDTAKIPIVLVTSKGTESDRFWGQRQGADEHVAKPFSPNALVSVIRRYMR